MARPRRGYKIDEKILAYLREHRRAVPKEMADAFGVPNSYIVQRLSELVKCGKVRKVTYGLYEYVEQSQSS